MENVRKLKETIEALEIRLRHLENDYVVTRRENEHTARKYLEILDELRAKNRQLLELQVNLEQMVARRTDQLQDARRVLQQKSLELEIMVEASPAMIFFKDRRRRFVRVNRAFSEMTGIPAAKAVGRTAVELFGEGAAGFLDRDQEVYATGKPLLGASEVLESPRGRRALLVDKIPVSGPEGEVEGVIGFAKDITEHLQLEEERGKASKLESLGMVAGGIAHDFNNILTAILGNITLARICALDPRQLGESLDQAERASLRARDLTQRLLTFARGGAPLKRPMRIEGLIRDSVGFALSGSSVRCEFNLPDQLRQVEADGGQLGQVLNNLVLNAIQAMPGGGLLQVGAADLHLEREGPHGQPPGDYVRITVADQGEGIPAEHLALIFDPYFTTRPGKSGLGLTVAYSIIKRHHGHLTVESEPGRGSVFSVWLQAHAPEREPGNGGSPAGRIAGARVLVMDDEELVRQVAGKMLRYLGCEAEFAGDGEEMLRAYAAAREAGQPFDLVIMDLTIPGGMGGREAVPRLLALDPRARAVVSSGYSSDPVLSDPHRYGFLTVVTKPYRIEELRAALEAALGAGMG